MKKYWPRLVLDALQLTGLGLIVAGVAHWSGPAAMIVAGVMLIVYPVVELRLFRA